MFMSTSPSYDRDYYYHLASSTKDLNKRIMFEYIVTKQRRRAVEKFGWQCAARSSCNENKKLS